MSTERIHPEDMMMLMMAIMLDTSSGVEDAFGKAEHIAQTVKRNAYKESAVRAQRESQYESGYTGVTSGLMGQHNQTPNVTR